jgi:hypothetical protein
VPRVEDLWGYKSHSWHMDKFLWRPVVAGRESSHQSKSCFGCSTDDKECKVPACSHGKAQSLEVVLSHTRICSAVSRFNEEGRCSQGDYLLFRE